MSEVEALLSVDSGRVPPGVTAFFQRDPEASRRRSFAWLAVIVDGFAVALLIAGVGKPGIAILALIGVALAIGAVPTKPDDDADEAPRKRPTLVVTPEGIVVRDDYGMRYWHFDDVEGVSPYIHQMSLGVLVLRKDGKRDFIDTTFFERGDKVRDVIGTRLRLRAVSFPSAGA